jgi:hypothetical protein
MLLGGAGFVFLKARSWTQQGPTDGVAVEDTEEESVGTTR